MNAFAPIIAYINNEQLITQDATIIVGLSGGPDSVFLFYLLLELKKSGRIKTIIAAHLDHEWRPESATDALFCRQLADAHGIPFETKKISELSIDLKWRGSKEEMGRTARRFFLESVAKQYNADAIALGHHAQDQQETFFIRLLRGSSLTGLCSMWPKRDLYIRPLLQTNKSEILQYLATHEIAYLEDPSNLEQTYLRNRIRSTVIPALKEADNRFDSSFNQTMRRLQETELYLDQHARDLFETMSSHRNGILEVSTSQLLAQPAIMQSRLIILWLTQEGVSFPATQSFIDEIVRFLNSPEGGTHHIHENWSLIKKKNMISIEKK